MSNPDNLLRLACEECWWTPEVTDQMSLVEEHWSAEHEGKPIRMVLAAFCPRDGLHMPMERIEPLRSGKARYHHTCAKCHRSYVIVGDGPAGE